MQHKWIPGYEGLYEITSVGTVIRYYKTTAAKESTGFINRSGYRCIHLSKNGKVCTKLIHRLVAEAFIPNPDNKLVVDHINEDKLDNNVNNLRWCSALENAKYYNTKDGRKYHIMLGKKRKSQLKAYAAKLQEKNKELQSMAKQLDKKQKQLDKAEKLLKEKEKELAKVQAALNKFIKEKIHHAKYTGYADISGIKFKSVDELVNITGKPIKINNQKFKSCGAAAKYIVEQELKEGKYRRHATVSKELRRFLQGKRPSWKMYGKYEVTSVD